MTSQIFLQIPERFSIILGISLLQDIITYDILCISVYPMNYFHSVSKNNKI